MLVTVVLILSRKRSRRDSFFLFDDEFYLSAPAKRFLTGSPPFDWAKERIIGMNLAIMPESRSSLEKPPARPAVLKNGLVRIPGLLD